MTSVDRIEHVWEQERAIANHKAWAKRRRDKGIEPTADDIWNSIKAKHPTLPEARQEAVFQAIG